MTKIDLLSPGEDTLERILDWRDRTAIGGWLAFDAAVKDGRHFYTLRRAEHHVGNEMTRSLHGGVISSFLQACAVNEIRSRLDPGSTARAISVHCNYLRPAADEDMFAHVDIIRHGRRISFVEATSWQADQDKPIGRAAVALRIMPTPTDDA
ncbi:PaaI family thioesterase [Parvularcula sp. LCG005]|uniref:PaaI family thioesterase n=1 Tax=Parvularcula sp. LCG005 TaxID=3078805 RepID=UPI0029424BCF|nr:PaaI family thioesterase [Parvularcula sp. LCG005]WOI54645.1 PaaI family thioesterase [Parvularcula sp. LCG005]